MQRPGLVFGFGSLVNEATHDLKVVGPAVLQGWRRVWHRTAGYRTTVLSVEPAPDTEIEGLLLHVDGAQVAALNQRESGYDFVDVTGAVPGMHPEVGTYVIPPASAEPATADHPILQSYVDVCVQGFLRHFGTDGVDRFFATTAGWGPMRDDRDAPLYARHQRLSPKELALVDQKLAALRS